MNRKHPDFPEKNGAWTKASKRDPLPHSQHNLTDSVQSRAIDRDPQQRSSSKLSGSKSQIGLWFVVLSTIALSIHNVIVRVVIGQPINLFGLFSFGGFIQPSLGNSLLILWMRMLVVVPLMMGISGLIYPNVWRDIQQILINRDRRPFFTIVASGGFLFLSQILIYTAIAQIGPGVAVTILFMYPLVTVPLAWWIFGDQLTRLRLATMVVILSGVILTATPSLKMGAAMGSGAIVAAMSGVAFALYLILMQISFSSTSAKSKGLHPVPVSLIQFFTILVLSSLILSSPIELGVAIIPANRIGFLLGGVVLGALTLIGYLANNFSVRFIGAAQASIVASSSPVITAVLAAIVLQTRLEPVQAIGIVLVTIGVVALSFERMRKSAVKVAK